ncbi:hypothetical protein [Yinghuangia sp. YIM S10712]|uniref:hypothetical protein n=1 Tax=Yinghuangia sp. YIM S10712 TaxID=3436930 RepID=UPI003F5302A0
MAGIEEGQWMRDRFEQGMRGGLPDTPAPHTAIEQGGRARRKRRVAVAGSVAAVVIAAAAVTGVTFLGGDDKAGPATAATPTVAATNGASSATPAPASTPDGSSPPKTPDGKLVVASGQFQGKAWEIVRVLGDEPPPGHPSATGAAKPNSAVDPGAADGPTAGPPYCEQVYLMVDAAWAATFLNPCPMAQPWEQNSGGRDAPVMRNGRGSGGGQTYIVLQVTPQVARAEVSFPDGSSLQGEPVPVPNTPEGFVVFELGTRAQAAARGATYTFTAYDAQGKQIDRDTFPNADS